jgi:hypothetical protein
MSGDDEQELRSRLDTVLMTVTPRAAPIDAVMRQGRRVIYRRRASVASGVAAVAIAAVTVPAALNQHAGPARPRPAAVTVIPPGPAALAGLIASGTVGSKRWSVRITGHVCAAVSGTAGMCGVDPHPAGLATLNGAGGPGHVTEYGPVKPSVTRVTVELGDGQLLVLHPVSAGGARWIAFPVPAGTHVRQVTAYAGRAELGYAIPFNGPSGTSNLPIITTWLAPVTAEPPPVTAQLGPGAVEHAGPWGRCFTVASPKGFLYCKPGFGPDPRNGELVTELIGPGPGGGTYLATTAAQVSHVTVTLSGGQLLRLPTVRGAYGEKFLTFTAAPGQQLRHLIAYGTDRQPLGSAIAERNSLRWLIAVGPPVTRPGRALVP